MRNRLIILIAVLSLIVPPLLLAQGPPPGVPGTGECPGGPCVGGPGGFGGSHFGPAEFRRGRGGRDGIPPRRFLENALNFTAVQFDALDALLEEHRALVTPLHEEMRALGEELRATLAGGAPNATVVGQLVIDIHNLRTQLADSRQALRDGFLALLTEEQAAILEDLRDNPPARGRRGPGRGPGNGN